MYHKYSSQKTSQRNSSPIIFGIHPIIEAIESGKVFDKILIRRDSKSPLIKNIEQLAYQHRIPLQYVPVEKLNSLTKSVHQGVVGFTALVEYQPLEELVSMCFESGKDPLFLVLDGVTDIRNFGAIARSAACFDVDGLVFSTKGSAQINPEAIKASAGSLTFLPLCRVDNIEDSLLYLRNSGVYIIGASEKASGKLSDSHEKLNRPLAIIMGGEDTGISTDIADKADEMMAISITSKISSLNVSVAASIFLYEVSKQRNEAEKE